MYPVLLVHGIDDTGSRLRKIQAVLQARGFGSVYAMDIIPPDASIPFSVMGEQVRDSVSALQQKTGAQKVDIVAYSMGTLAVRYFLQRLDGRLLVRRFISLAGPHHGTLMAYFCQKVGCRQMRPTSQFLQELNADSNKWGAVDVYSFWSPLDLMVFPARTSVLEHAHNRAFSVLLHPWMTSDQRVLEAVVQTLSVTD
jgi:triacylglycerol lipase